MASKEKATVAAAAPAHAGTGKKYPVAKLRLSCRQLFGVSTSTFDGATYGLTEAYTVEELRTHIKTWGEKKGVK